MDLYKNVPTIGIARISPPILKRGQIWFEKNEHNVREEARKITSWWHSNYKELQVDEKLPLSTFLRQLDDWGYIKTGLVKNPGEFASRGGVGVIFSFYFLNYLPS